MKKTIASICILAGVLGVRADVITNYVYTVSNIFHNVYFENVVTQKVKSSHTDYFYTNYVSVVTNVYQTTFRTNMSVNVDVSQRYVNEAANAASNALSFAAESAVSATAAGSSASAASASADQAAASAVSASSAASQGLQRINERINWFDQHSGETITMVNINTNVNINVDAQDYSYAYTNNVGVVFDYVVVHPFGVNGGATVLPRSKSSYSTVSIRAWPRTWKSGKAVYWDFSPAYIDYDENGMRLQYLPDSATPILYHDANGNHPNGEIVPECFYWQSGYIYFNVRVWEGGVVVGSCKTRYKWDNWPTPIGYGSNNGTAMSLVSKQSYGDVNMGNTLAYFLSLTRTETTNVPIEFPLNVNPSGEAIVRWMSTGVSNSSMNDRLNELNGKIDDLTNAVGFASTDRINFYKAARKYVYTRVTTTEGIGGEITFDYVISPDIVVSSNDTKVVYYERNDFSIYAEKTGDRWDLVFPMSYGIHKIDMGESPDNFPTSSSNVITYTGALGVETGRIVFNRAYLSGPELAYFISSDFNVYDARSNVIDRLVRESQLSSLSNWVENVFQKK